MKYILKILLFVLLFFSSCYDKNQSYDKNNTHKKSEHKIYKIVCSSGSFLVHNIEIQSDGLVIYKGINDFNNSEDQYHYEALYIGSISEKKFNEIAKKLIQQKYLTLNEYEKPENRPTPGNFLQAYIYHKDTLKYLSHYNDSISSLLLEILELRKEANLKLILKKTQKLFESEIPPPPCK